MASPVPVYLSLGSVPDCSAPVDAADVAPAKEFSSRRDSPPALSTFLPCEPRAAEQPQFPEQPSTPALSVQQAAIDLYFNEIDRAEKMMASMKEARSDSAFALELRAIEDWVRVLSDVERAAAVYSLLSFISPDQIRFFITVLNTMSRRKSGPKIGNLGHSLATPSSPMNQSSKIIPSRVPDADWSFSPVSRSQSSAAPLSQPAAAGFDSMPQRTQASIASAELSGLYCPPHLRPGSTPPGPSGPAEFRSGVPLFSKAPPQPLLASPFRTFSPAPLATRAFSPSPNALHRPFSPSYLKRNLQTVTSAYSVPPAFSAQSMRFPLTVNPMIARPFSPAPRSAISLSGSPSLSASNYSPRPLTPEWPRYPEKVDFAILESIPTWLRSMRLHKYTPNFEATGQDWKQIIEMSEEQLIKIGVGALGARTKFLKVFSQIKSEMNPPATPTDTPVVVSSTPSTPALGKNSPWRHAAIKVTPASPLVKTISHNDMGSNTPSPISMDENIAKVETEVSVSKLV